MNEPQAVRDRFTDAGEALMDRLREVGASHDVLVAAEVGIRQIERQFTDGPSKIAPPVPSGTALRPWACPVCGGQGWSWSRYTTAGEQCRQCNGTGLVWGAA